MKEGWIYRKEEKSRLAVNEGGLHLPVGAKKSPNGKLH